MMKKKAVVNWLENFRLEGRTDNDQIVHMDSGDNPSAASPAQLVLQALAGCTMMDCVHIIKRSRKHLQKFWIDVEAEEAQAQPKVFTSIHLSYTFVSHDLTEAEAERAIKLSEDKFCRVHAMLKASVKLTSSFRIIKES